MMYDFSRRGYNMVHLWRKLRHVLRCRPVYHPTPWYVHHRAIWAFYEQAAMPPHPPPPMALQTASPTCCAGGPLALWPLRLRHGSGHWLLTWFLGFSYLAGLLCSIFFNSAAGRFIFIYMGGLLVSGSSALMYGELCVSQYGGLSFGASGCNCWAGSEAGPGVLASGGSIWARRVLWSEGRHPSRLQSPFPAALQVLSLPLPACVFSSACIVYCCRHGLLGGPAVSTSVCF